MTSSKSTGRTIGLLLLLQFACGLIVPFVLWQTPLGGTSTEFLTNAAASSSQVRLAVAIAFFGAALTTAIAITAYPVVRRLSQTLALSFLIVCALSTVMDALHNATVMMMLSQSTRFIEAGSPNTDSFMALAATVKSIRFWVHYTQLLFVGVWIFTFYLVMMRLALLPRVLAALGLLGIMLQFTGVTLPVFADYESIQWLAMVLAPVHVTTSLWLMIKGFPGIGSAAGSS